MLVSVYGSKESAKQIDELFADFWTTLTQNGIQIWKSWDPCLPGELTARAFKRAEEADLFLVLLDDEFLSNQFVAGKFYRILNTKPNTPRLVLALKQLNTPRLDKYLWRNSPLDGLILIDLKVEILNRLNLQ